MRKVGSQACDSEFAAPWQQSYTRPCGLLMVRHVCQLFQLVSLRLKSPRPPLAIVLEQLDMATSTPTKCPQLPNTKGGKEPRTRQTTSRNRSLASIRIGGYPWRALTSVRLRGYGIALRTRLGRLAILKLGQTIV